MKVIKNNLYRVTYKYSKTWEDFKYVKANSIVEAIDITVKYTKEIRNIDIDIVKIESIGDVLESSTKTITVDV